MKKKTAYNQTAMPLPAFPDRISAYLRMEKRPLLLVIVAGLIYNIGLFAGPFFEGELAQCLWDIAGGKTGFSTMVALALCYVSLLLLVHTMRFLKRFWVRRFANDVNRTMRHVLYNRLLFQNDWQDSVGTVMTKAVSDVDDCAEGMRKVTTEIFDTGIALITYLVMLFCYDWRLALISCLFTPPAYFLAEMLKKPVCRFTAAAKESAGKLNDAAIHRVSLALTYRVMSSEQRQNEVYEKRLADYEKRHVAANFLENFMPPLYRIITMLGVIPILWFGSRNLTGNGWTVWNIAAFTAFLSCFSKMAIKASKAAKLFNAIQKAQVSFHRLKPQLCRGTALDKTLQLDVSISRPLSVQNLSFTYPGALTPIFTALTFTLNPGEILGVSGGISSGKSTLGYVFGMEHPYTGHIFWGDKAWKDLSAYERSCLMGYLGHDPELLNDTIKENICLGIENPTRLRKCLQAVCLEEEIAAMPNGVFTLVGSSGVRLSGGQAARLALARTLFHGGKLLILDDPFSAVDRTTESKIFANIRHLAPDAVILLLTHRVYLFSQCDKVLFLENGHGTLSDHATLQAENPTYARLCALQGEGGDMHA